MKVLTAVLFVLAHASISSCRTQHASHDVTEPEVANVAPRKVPTLAQLIPILEGPDLPEVKLRKLRKLIPIYDDLTKWRIDHSQRLVEILPYKKKEKPLAFILAGNDYLKLKKPDSDHNTKNNAKNDEEHESHTNDSDESNENSKFDVIHTKGYKEHPHTKSDYYRHSYKDKNDKKYHSSELSHDNENKKHRNDNYKSELNSNESESEPNEHNESGSVTESNENKSVNTNNSKEEASENDIKSDRKKHEQGSHTKRPHRKSYRHSKYLKHSYKDCKRKDCKADKKHKGQGYSSERHNNKIYTKNKNTDNSGSYSNEFESESNESNEDNESWSEATESKSTENKSTEDKNMEKSNHIHNSNKSRLLTSLNKFSIHDTALQEASNSASEGLLSNHPYFIPHSNISSVKNHYAKPDISLSDIKTDSTSSTENSLTANSDSKVNVIASEIRTVSESLNSTENVSIHAVSLESNDLSQDSNVEFKDDVAFSNNLSESMSDSVSDESISNNINESKSEADSGIGPEKDSKTTQSDEKELPDAQFRSIFPVESPSNKYTESSDINSNDLETGTGYISDLESNQSSMKSTESQSESDSNYIPEATTAELAVSAELKSDALESIADENSSMSASISNESTPDSMPYAESTSELKSTVSDETKSEFISEESVSDVSKVPGSVSESNSSGLDSISEVESDGLFNVKPNEYYVSTEKSNEFRGSESTSEANSNESVVSYDGNESADLREETNELTSTDSNESKSNVADVNESGISNPGVELTDFNKPYETKSESQSDIMEVGALNSDENDVGDLDVTEKSYGTLSNEIGFDENGKMLENLGLFASNNVGNEEPIKHNNDRHHASHGKRISDSNVDIQSVDTNHETEQNDKRKQDLTSNIEKEDLVEVGDAEEIRTPHVLLVENHHLVNTEAPIHKSSMKEYNKYDVGDVSSYVVKHNKIINNEESVATPVVLEDYEDERNIVNSTEHEKQREFTPINIIIKKNDDKDSITKNILIEYDMSKDNDIIIDARTDKQDKDLIDNEKHDSASDVKDDVKKHQYIDVNTNTQQLDTNQELATNVNCNTSNNILSVAPKEKHQHKTYKLSFIFN